jgi:hypothetical protein
MAVPSSVLILLRVNWIYAIATFTVWKYAITKIKLVNMPFQLPYTSSHAISSNTSPNIAHIPRTYRCTPVETREKEEKE